MTIKHWPQNERPRERLQQHGAEALSNSDLLSIILTKGHAGKSAVDLARDLITEFGSLQKLFQASNTSFSKVKGMGPAKIAQLKAAYELARRAASESIQPETKIKNSASTKQFLKAQLQDHDHEVFAALFLDIRHRVLKFEKLFFGSLTHANVHIRVVLKKALELNAAAIIVAHNHPSGHAEPSLADYSVTQQLEESLDIIDVKLLDHIIVGGKHATSLREMGWDYSEPKNLERK